MAVVPGPQTPELPGPEMEPGHGSPGHWVTGSAILTGSGQVTGQCVRSVFEF